MPSYKEYRDGTVPSHKKYRDGTVPSHKKYRDGTVPSRKRYRDGTVLSDKKFFYYHLYLSQIMQYKKDKHMQAYLMGGKKKINV